MIIDEENVGAMPRKRPGVHPPRLQARLPLAKLRQWNEAVQQQSQNSPKNIKLQAVWLSGDSDSINFRTDPIVILNRR
jgi:hypothetical protein